MLARLRFMRCDRMQVHGGAGWWLGMVWNQVSTILVIMGCGWLGRELLKVELMTREVMRRKLNLLKTSKLVEDIGSKKNPEHSVEGFKLTDINLSWWSDRSGHALHIIGV